MHKGVKIWEGTRHEILRAQNKELSDFVYATKFLQQFRDRLEKE
jgi:phospholipid/cholesterol/gamma-HCH transport system ATP-binding protein